jgi:glycosyltransferase involved in cell wall biosynthesis
MSKKKLAIITSHPIQYNAPVFKLLTERGLIECRVFYSWGKSAIENKYDPGFGKIVKWDIPLLDGYAYEFLENVSRHQGSDHFRGIINPDIVERINAYDPDAILVFGWAFQSHLKVLRHFGKKKTIIFRGDSTLLDKTTFLRREARLLFLKWVYTHIDYALYVGSNNYRYFKKMGVKQDRLLYAPHAIDNNRFSGSGDEYEQRAIDLRKEMGIDPHEIVFLYAGKLEDKKDVRLLLQTFMQFELYNRAQLVIVGNGGIEKDLKVLYKRIPGIHFKDFQNQSMMPVIYRLADVYVLPSKGPGDTWGLAVNEAMACGRAVLVSDKCGCAVDLVEEGYNGFTFVSGNMDDLRAKLNILIELGKEGLRVMGKNSQSKIMDFSFEKFCRVTEDLLMSDNLLSR